MARLRLSALAARDIEEILTRSQAAFGEAARLRYEALIAAGLRTITADPRSPGVRQRDDLGAGTLAYHLFHVRQTARLPIGVVRRPRHIVVFRLAPPDFVHVARILHDAMDLKEHLPEGLYRSGDDSR